MAKGKAKVRANESNVKEADFIKAYMEAFNAKEGIAGVAKRTKLANGSVTTRAANMRKAGIPLPKFPVGGGVKRDLEAAKALVASLTVPATPAK